jgi:hypothetical protein
MDTFILPFITIIIDSHQWVCDPWVGSISNYGWQALTLTAMDTPIDENHRQVRTYPLTVGRYTNCFKNKSPAG